jgi:hypothetical protein
MPLLTLSLPDGTEPPSAYLKATPDEVLEMLTIGALVREVILTHKSEDDAKTRAAEYTKEIGKLQENKAAEVAALKARYEKETASIKAAVEAQAAVDRALLLESHERVKKQQEATLHTVSTDLRAAEGRLAELTARKAAADADVAAQLRHVKEAEMAASERILVAKDAELHRLVRDKETAEADRRLFLGRAQALEDRLAALSEALHRKPATAKDKGAAFEAAMDELLRQQWGAADGFSIADVSQKGHLGDRLVTLGALGGGQTILLECKDYGDVVPKAEVEKFFKDVSTNHKVTIGLMVSRRTPIQGHSSHSAIEFCVHEGKLCLFVNAFDRLDAASTVAQWLAWIRYWTLIQKPSTEVEDKAEAIRTIKELVDKAQTDARTLGEHLRHLDELKQFVKRTVDDTHRRLQEALVGLQRGAATAVLANAPLFREGATEAEKVWETRIVAATEPGMGLRLSDLADRLATEEVKTDRVRTLIEPLFLPTVLTKQPGKATRIEGLQLRSLSHV